MPDEALFKKVPVKVQKRSGYDKSNHNLFTGKVGELIPLFCEEVIPNHTISTKVAISTQLPPLATDTFMRLSQKVEAFFVPTRLLMKDYDKWITRNHKIGDTNFKIAAPVISVPYKRCGQGSLLDYLGVMVSKQGMIEAAESTANPSKINISAFPVLCYSLIWDEWYRNSLIQRSCFYDEAEFSQNSSSLSDLRKYTLAKMKFITPTTGVSSYIDVGTTYQQTGNVGFSTADNWDFLDLRFCNFPLDYFTSATPSPQNGPASVISIDTSGATGSLSIAALRSANSIQQFEERQNLAGNRLVDFVKAQYGANLSDMIAQRPVLLGSASFDVYSKGIFQTANGAEGIASNPYSGSVGARFGSAYAEGTDFIIKDFTANEPGYIMIISRLVPKVTYSSGLKRYLTHYTSPDSQGDMANPILQNVGPQPIYQRELNDSNIFQLNESSFDDVFGYADRYSEFKSNQDELHGLIRDGYSMSSFALQRSFHSASVEISNDFLQIPLDYLDQVLAVSTNDGLTYWTDSYIQSFESMPLSRYSIPTLQDPAYEHGRTIVLDKGGVKLD